MKEKSFEILEENEDIEAKADKIAADKIIDAFIYKKPKAFDLDDQEDVISYEDREARLLWMLLDLP